MESRRLTVDQDLRGADLLAGRHELRHQVEGGIECRQVPGEGVVQRGEQVSNGLVLNVISDGDEED